MRNPLRSLRFGAALLLVMPVTWASGEATAVVADAVLTHGRIYTAAGPQLAEALAFRQGKIVYIGDARGAQPYIGAHTQHIDAHGRLVVPGLVDSHIHPIDIIDVDQCDLNSVGKSLRQLAAFVQGCVKRFHPAPGQWLAVHQWSSTSDNRPDAQYPTLRAALDKGAPANPVYLMGDDGHRAAYSSSGLALARNAAGRVVGISKETLASEFSGYRLLIGVDARGEPDGQVNEQAQSLMDTGYADYTGLQAALAKPERIPYLLNRAGITAVLDAAVAPEGLPVYDKLLSDGRLTVHTTLAQYYDPDRNRDAQGHVDYAAMTERAIAVRAKYANNPLLRADFVKIFADGVAEGNPFAIPPTLGNAAMLAPYLQPKFARDADGRPIVTGYVDTDAALCQNVRAHPDQYGDIAKFTKAHGYHPGQCQISNGQLKDDREVIMEYAKRMHLAGFNLHIHVIGDRAARTAIDAIEAARAADGVSSTHDSLAHLQFVHPDDLVRLGRDHLYVAYTMWWATSSLDYDMTIVPFVQHVTGNSYASRMAPGSFYVENSYPVRATRDAGGIVVGGSDAPVGRRDPQPFVNIATGVLRHAPGEMVLNARQAITVREALNAYTIDGARFLGRAGEFGSLEVGKSADFVVLDRDILALADKGNADAIAGTKVLETWFRGARVYHAAENKAP
ncbi:MAG TPA: amidohydrolase family protein [Steroidobacteraceae bacterium]|nr:amidohydrolase family protein [Steroidobacteraceae bacterium]